MRNLIISYSSCSTYFPQLVQVYSINLIPILLTFHFPQLIFPCRNTMNLNLISLVKYLAFATRFLADSFYFLLVIILFSCLFRLGFAGNRGLFVGQIKFADFLLLILLFVVFLNAIMLVIIRIGFVGHLVLTLIISICYFLFFADLKEAINFFHFYQTKSHSKYFKTSILPTTVKFMNSFTLLTLSIQINDLS